MNAARRSPATNPDASSHAEDGTPARRGRLVQQEEDVFARIQEAILDHRLPPGTQLKEVPLSEVFGVTRGMLRKVLTRLAHTKLVEQRPNRGAVVASPSVEESRDLFAARRAIEGAIVDILCQRITRAQVKTLRRMISDEHQAYAKGELRSGLKQSIDFHRVLAEMAGNSVLAEFLEELVTRTPLVILAYKDHKAKEPGCDTDDHGAIVDALEAGDAATATRVMHEHLAELESQLNLREDHGATDLAAIFSQ